MYLRLVNSALRSSICLEADGDQIWTGTYTGLYRYDIATNNYTEVRNAVAGAQFDFRYGRLHHPG